MRARARGVRETVKKRLVGCKSGQVASSVPTSMDLSSLQAEMAELTAALAAKQAQVAAAAQGAASVAAPYSRSFGRASISSILASPGKGLSLVGSTLRVGGWVKTGRTANKDEFAFLELNDGSCPTNLQARGGGACSPARAPPTSAVRPPHLIRPPGSPAPLRRCWSPRSCTRLRSCGTPGAACWWRGC